MLVNQIKIKKDEEIISIHEDFVNTFQHPIKECMLTTIVKKLINYEESMCYSEVCIKLADLKQKAIKNRNILETHVKSQQEWRNVLDFAHNLVRFINRFIYVPLTYEDTSDLVLFIITENEVSNVKECLDFFSENYPDMYNRKDVVELFKSFN